MDGGDVASEQTQSLSRASFSSIPLTWTPTKSKAGPWEGAGPFHLKSVLSLRLEAMRPGWTSLIYSITSRGCCAGTKK